jgi:hypothetical protein
MKRFLVSALCISVFFLGLGTLIEKVGARFKSDEKALDLIKAARTAIGGGDSIAGIQSLRIKGTTTNTFKIDGIERIESGETEIAMQMPDKLSKMVKIGRSEGDETSDQMVNKRVETVIVRKDKDGNEIGGAGSGTGIGTKPETKRVIVKKDGDAPAEFKTEDGQTVFLRKGDPDVRVKVENDVQTYRVNRDEMESHHRQAEHNELFRLALGLLLSPPAAMAVNYTFGGEVRAADKPCNLIIAETGGTSVKLYLDRDSNLPVMMAYTAEAMPMFVRFNKETPAPANGGDKNVIFFKHTAGDPASAEYQVRFDDYRNVGGVQVPFKWVTTAGDMNEVFNVTDYEINPSNISDSFSQPKVMLRVKKDGQ